VLKFASFSYTIVVQEIYLTREEAVAASVPDTYIDPLTGLYEVE
jgi:hypothetical protein